MVFRTLSIELARRGHELTIFTTNPMNDPTVKNYTEVDLHYLYSSCNIDFYSKISLGPWSFLSDTYNVFDKISDKTLSHPAMQQLLSPNNTKKFDLVIVQSLYFDALYAISYRLNAPLIGMISNPPMAIHQYILGKRSVRRDIYNVWHVIIKLLGWMFIEYFS
jgi:glucuronosyltransferase